MVITITELRDIDIVGANADTVTRDGNVVINAFAGERAETHFKLRLTPAQARKVATDLWHAAKDAEDIGQLNALVAEDEERFREMGEYKFLVPVGTDDDRPF